ncbi:nuclear transport factor 2 family protein [Streptomyces regalis]|uniref:SnoaL-like domain-containing protein n=1 Tax=Streptomyces regalis TaxID=68262 RepID=A0A117ML63_9ACTN|nr:nuclear transport factor 2 family protein [Streptomyces regalis]KUL23216.1 hypothetical protein ADL12_39745 [Streptomyces regalis]
MTPEQTRAVHAETFRTWATALEADDLATYLDCFTPDVEFEDIPLQITLHGREELGKAVSDGLKWLGHERIDIDLHLEGTDGHAAVMMRVHMRIRDQIPAIPHRVNVGTLCIVHTTSVFLFDEDGRFTWERCHWDLGELLRQIRAPQA